MTILIFDGVPQEPKEFLCHIMFILIDSQFHLTCGQFNVEISAPRVGLYENYLIYALIQTCALFNRNQVLYYVENRIVHNYKTVKRII